MSITDFLQSTLSDSDQHNPGMSLVGVIDQLEEILDPAPELDGYRREFLDQLAEAVDRVDRVHLLLVVKDEAVGQLLGFEDRLSARLWIRFRVEPLRRDQALEAAVRPLDGSARRFAPGVAEELVDQLRTTTITNVLSESHTVVDEFVEPVNLQVVCSELWWSLPDTVTEITADHLQHIDIQTTLTGFCRAAVDAVAVTEEIDVLALWDWLAGTFITDRGTRGTAYEGVASTGSLPNPVARRFVDLGILRIERRARSVWFELLHDRLIEPIRQGRSEAQGWPIEVQVRPSPREMLQMAEAARADGLLADAERFASRAAEDSDEAAISAEAEFLLGKLALAQGVARDDDQALLERAEGHYARAAEHLVQARNPRGAGRVFVARAGLLNRRRRYADAMAVVRGALDRAPPTAGMHLEMARALRGLGQPQAAFGQYRQALDARPDGDERLEALIGRAGVEADIGDPAAALRDLDEAVRSRPEAAERADVIEARRRAEARRHTWR